LLLAIVLPGLAPGSLKSSNVGRRFDLRVFARLRGFLKLVLSARVRCRFKIFVLQPSSPSRTEVAIETFSLNRFVASHQTGRSGFSPVRPPLCCFSPAFA
jgi:hypothetical protein